MATPLPVLVLQGGQRRLLHLQQDGVGQGGRPPSLLRASGMPGAMGNPAEGLGLETCCVFSVLSFFVWVGVHLDTQKTQKLFVDPMAQDRQEDK